MRFQPILLLLFIAACFSGCASKSSESPPNVIFIFPDQYRNFSLGFWSQKGNDTYIQGNPDPVSTPTLDKLANEGIVFNRAVSNFPLCSPYRGMFMTGMYPDHNGLPTNCRADRPNIQLRTDAECITDVFSKAGYNVAYFGKCHWQETQPLFDENGNFHGTTDEPGGHFVNRYDTYVPPGPDRHSIDYFFQALKDEHYNPRVYSNDPRTIQGKKDGELHLPKRFSSELESEVIMDYLSNTHGQRDPEKPFFMIWSLNPPHNPWNEENTDMAFYDQYTQKRQGNLANLLTRQNADTVVGNYAQYYFTNVSAVDFYIGNVLDHLDKLGLTENTIIVFSSDHGEMLGSHGQRGKPYPEMEAFNIPFVLKWGKKLEHRIEDLMLSVPDVMPTLLGLVGLEQLIPPEVQGMDYSDIFIDGESLDIEKPSSVLFMRPRSRGVYTGEFTFVVEEEDDKSVEIYAYDNYKDPYQLKKIPFADLANGDRLKSELIRLLKRTNDRWYQQNVCADFLNYQ